MWRICKCTQRPRGKSPKSDTNGKFCWVKSCCKNRLITGKVQSLIARKFNSTLVNWCNANLAVKRSISGSNQYMLFAKTVIWIKYVPNINLTGPQVMNISLFSILSLITINTLCISRSILRIIFKISIGPQTTVKHPPPPPQGILHHRRGIFLHRQLGLCKLDSQSMWVGYHIKKAEVVDTQLVDY